MRLLSSIIVLALTLSQGFAHESPSHTLEELNKHISEKPTPELLFQRALTHKALGKFDLAHKDLATATQAKPKIFAWQLERCRLELTSKRPDKALQIANAALKLAKDCPERAEIHILRAQAYQETGKHKPALHAYQLAFKELPAGKIEWFIFRSESQRQLGQHDERVRGLRAGLKQFPDSILKPQLVEALIDGGKHIEALAHIHSELPTLRFKSAWLIKRAQAKIGQKQTAEAQKDLHTALDEINGRLNPAKPDPLLLADKAQICILLGDNNAARACLGQLKKHRAPQWITKRLEADLSKK